MRRRDTGVVRERWERQDYLDVDLVPRAPADVVEHVMRLDVQVGHMLSMHGCYTDTYLLEDGEAEELREWPGEGPVFLVPQDLRVK